MASDSLEKAIRKNSNAISRNYHYPLADQILLLAKEIDAISYENYTHLEEQPKTAINIIRFAIQGHPIEVFEKYREIVVNAWEELDGCYKDASNPDLASIGLDNINEHMGDLNEYIAGLSKYLAPAITAAGPKLSPRVFPVMDAFEKSKGTKLLRGTAWAYKISFLSALANTVGDYSGENAKTNPLAELEKKLKEALAASQSNLTFIDDALTTVDYAERKTQHKLIFQIGEYPFTINGPYDAKGMEALIRAAFYNSEYSCKG